MTSTDRHPARPSEASVRVAGTLLAGYRISASDADAYRLAHSPDGEWSAGCPQQSPFDCAEDYRDADAEAALDAADVIRAWGNAFAPRQWCGYEFDRPTAGNLSGYVYASKDYADPARVFLDLADRRGPDAHDARIIRFWLLPGPGVLVSISDPDAVRQEDLHIIAALGTFTR